MDNPENKTDPAVENPAVDNIEASASLTDAGRLVGDDTDRPKADNTIPPPDRPNERPDDPTVSVPKKRGRPKKTDEQRAAEAAAKARPAPSFADIGSRSVPGSLVSPVPLRDYTQDALTIFVPVSMGLSKILGDHWGIAVIKTADGKPDLDFTDDQKLYIKQMASWMEYEKFGPVSPRWGFALGTVMYAVPRLRVEPTPERLKKGWRRLTNWIGSLFGRKKVVREEKEQK